MQGFISLHRKLIENPIWTDSNYLKLWIYCLFKASHQEHDQLVGNQIVTLQRGQFVTGRFSLAHDLNKGVKPDLQLSEKTWSRYLKNLEKWQMLTIKVTNKFSVVTIVNYGFYQDCMSKSDHQSDQQLTNRCPTNDQQLTTNNNGNNGNKEKRHKQVYDEASSFYQLAELLYQQILTNNADYKKPNLQTWSDDIRKMVEIDGRTEEQIKYLIKWVQQDEFEMVNVLSPAKLRKRFDQLVLKVKREKEKKVSPLEPRREPKRNSDHIEKMKRLHGG